MDRKLFIKQLFRTVTQYFNHVSDASKLGLQSTVILQLEVSCYAHLPILASVSFWPLLIIESVARVF